MERLRLGSHPRQARSFGPQTVTGQGHDMVSRMIAPGPVQNQGKKVLLESRPLAKNLGSLELLQDPRLPLKEGYELTEKPVAVGVRRVFTWRGNRQVFPCLLNSLGPGAPDERQDEEITKKISKKNLPLA